MLLTNINNMPVILVIEKNGNVKEVTVNTFEHETLCAKANVKKVTDLKKRTTWKVEIDKKYEVVLYAKDSGRAGSENKFEFPPPVDNELYFGNCILLNLKGNLKKTEWEDIYNHLYGGFEDLSNDDEDEEEETDLPMTKEGYVKDDFIVDGDDDEDDDYYEDDEEEEEFEEEVAPRRTKREKTQVESVVYETDELNFEEELQEEEYV